jgi:hypothetical protein
MLIWYIMLWLPRCDIVMMFVGLEWLCCFKSFSFYLNHSCFCVISYVICITISFLSHTHLGTPRITKFRGGLPLCMHIDYDQWLRFKFNAYTKGEPLVKFGVQKASILSILCKPKLVVINYQKGGVCKCIRPRCGFWIINDNQIRD